MKHKICGLLLLATAVCVIKAQSKCPAAIQPPDECFSLDEIKDYGSTAASIESLYNRYVNLLTDAGLTIDGNEVCCGLI